MDAKPQRPRLAPIAEINQLPNDAFVEALKPLFETAPPLAAGLFSSRPYRSFEELLDHAETVIAGLTTSQKIEVINAHPRIGETSDAVRRQSAISYREQGYDSEATLDQDELAQVYRRLAELNRAYEARFGFRFVVFVNRRPKSAIVAIIEQRLERTREEEIATALNQMLMIARDRLATLKHETRPESENAG